MGTWQFLMPLLVSVILIGSLNSTLFVESRFVASAFKETFCCQFSHRYIHAASRKGHMPKFLSISNKKHDSPRCAVFYSMLMSMCFCIIGNPDSLIQYLSFAQWCQRMLTMCALIYLRLTHKPVHPDRIRTPLVLPIIFCLVCAALVGVTLWQDIKSAAFGLAFLTIGFFFYAMFLWSQAPLLRFDFFRNSCHNLNGMRSQHSRRAKANCRELCNRKPDRFQRFSRRRSHRRERHRRSRQRTNTQQLVGTSDLI